VGQANQGEDATVRVPDDKSPDGRRTTTSTRGSPTPNDTAIGPSKVYRAAAVRDNHKRPMKPRQSGVPVITLATRNHKFGMCLPPRCSTAKPCPGGSWARGSVRKTPHVKRPRISQERA